MAFAFKVNAIFYFTDWRNIMKYNIIYADPPWQYKRKKGQGVAENHYPTMSIKDLCNLQVDKIAEKHCILFLWVTFPQLENGLHLIKAWGFVYKTVAFVWVKLNRKSKTPFWGLGNWTRSNSEICLLGTKGHPKRISKRIHQLICTPIQEHSRKPEQAREKIIELIGNLPRIELFAREKEDGWDVWGNEIENSIELPEIADSINKSRQEGQAACEAKAAGTD